MLARRADTPVRPDMAVVRGGLLAGWMAMNPGGGPWTWKKVSVLHPPVSMEEGRRQCSGAIRSHVYRIFAFESSLYERCVGLSWCSACRRYVGGVVHVPRDEVLPDPLQLGLDEEEVLEGMDACATYATSSLDAT